MVTQGSFIQSEQDRGLARRGAIDRRRQVASRELFVGKTAASCASRRRYYRLNQRRHAWAQGSLRTCHRKHAARQPQRDGVKPA